MQHSIGREARPFSRITGSAAALQLSLAGVALLLAGCGARLPADGPMAGPQLRGLVHGGQQPVSGAAIQLYAAGTTGYGSAATPLLSTPVLSGSDGSFSITGDYTCPSSTSQVYLVASGGNPGLVPGANNAALAMMAALGPCTFLNGGVYTLNPASFITVNEETTVASVIALAQFMGDAAHVGTSSTNSTGLANAFGVAGNLVNSATGAALATTPAGNGTVPLTTLNTLANILATCVNSNGTTPCTALFGLTTPSGGTAPLDTVQAMLEIALNPSLQVSALYALATPASPFQPTLTAAPNDWTIAVTYGGGGISNAVAIAVDAGGNAWVASNGLASNQSSVAVFGPAGAVLSGNTGYTGGGMSFSSDLAIDPSGNAWVSGYGNSNVVELSSSGAILSGPSGFTGTGLNFPAGIAVDGAGSAWVADQDSGFVVKISRSGAVLSESGVFPAPGAPQPFDVAIDTAGDAWIADESDRSLAELSNSGGVLSGSGGYTFSSGQIHPAKIAIDAQGNVWTNNFGSDVVKVSSAGALLSPTPGYPICVAAPANNCTSSAPSYLAIDGGGHVWAPVITRVFNTQTSLFTTVAGVVELNGSGAIVSGGTGYTGGGAFAPDALAVDGSGNLWAITANNTVSELLGVATPVVTPLSVGVKNSTLGTRP